MRDRYASLREGLVGAWIPSVSGSGLLLPDLSGQGNNGTLTNMGPEDWVSSQYGRALDFDGVDDYVDASQKALISQYGQFTISAFIKTNTLSGFPVVFGQYIGTTGNGRLLLRLVSGAPSLFLGNIGAYPSVSVTGSVISTTIWSHIVAVRKAGFYSLYVNGVVDATHTEADGRSILQTGNLIGARTLNLGDPYNTNLTDYADGQLDDIRIYNRALSEPEIKLLSKEPGVGFKRTRSVFDFGRKPAYLPPTPTDYRTVRVKQTEHASLREGLVGAWCPSIEGGGYTLPDLSGQGNNGTLTNMGPEDWVSSQYGRALDFDGVDDYVGTNFNPSTAIGNGNQWSVSLWLNQVAAKNNARVLGNSLSVRWYIATSTTVVFWGWGSAFSASTGLTLSFGKWQHVVISYNIATIAIECHLDGHLTSSVPYTGNGLFTSALTQIGDIVASSLPFNGQLDDIRIYNRALSEPEIKLLASRPGIGLRPQRRTMYYAPPTGARRRRILTSMP